MPHNSVEKKRAYGRVYMARRSAKFREEGRCPACGRERDTTWITCSRCQARQRRNSKNYMNKLKLQAYERYGGARCACCGETELCFLTIDHINGGGRAHLRQMAQDGPFATIYQWLRDNHYPPGFQVLCANCNMGRWRNGGICPHQSKASSS